MKFKKLTYKQTYLISILPGEDIIEQIAAFKKEQGITSGYLVGIGATTITALAHYSVETKEYTEKTLREPLELASLNGIITEDKVHIHAVFGTDSYASVSGHLTKAFVFGACEIILVETEESTTRIQNPQTGLDLLNI